MKTRLGCCLLAIMAALVPPAASQNFSGWSAPVNLGAPVNTVYEDADPFLTKDGMTLYFNCRCPDSLGGFDIYFSEWDTQKGEWGTPQHLPAPLNSAYDESNATLTIDGHRLYFRSDRPGGFGGGDLYVVRRRDKRDNRGWGEPVNLGPGVNTSAGENSPFFLEDETTGVASLYFASDRAGSLGDDDIYRATLLPDETFGAVIHVLDLSSTGADRHPNLRRDGLEVFFMSNRDGSIKNAKGGNSFDIWSATRSSTLDPWGEPTNVTAINGPTHDAHPSLSFDGATLYFFSARPGNLSPVFDIWVARREKIKADE
ncbi:MAG TPA: hypothetical protein VFU76_02140 [Terriglobales bacterium]|nr:hypothetical protein [Terriglobales bacterium]